MIPSYSDIGKAAKDLLSKDYPVGSSKFELSTTSASGLKVTVTGDKDNKSGAVLADLKYKYSDKSRGITVTQTIKTSSALIGQLQVEDSILPGMKLDVEGWLNESGFQTVKTGTEYKTKWIYTKSVLDLYSGPTIYADFSTGNNGLLLGGEALYDVRGAKLKKWGYVAGFVGTDYAITGKGVNNCGGLEISYYQKVSSDTEVAIKSSSSFKANLANVVIEAGGKYTLDHNAFVKAKTDSKGMFGIGYTQNLRPGFKLSIGGLFDTLRLSENAHKLGISLNIEA